MHQMTAEDYDYYICRASEAMMRTFLTWPTKMPSMQHALAMCDEWNQTPLPNPITGAPEDPLVTLVDIGGIFYVVAR